MVCGNGVLPCSMGFDVSSAPAIFRPKGGTGRHQCAPVVLLDPTVELGWLRLGLAMAVAGGENSWLD
jgi:hypothetical protein